MKFQVVRPGTTLLKEIISLADRNRASLGLFPRGAFEDHAARRNIIAALSDSGDLYGYVLYRVVQRSEVVVLAHLCITASCRGKGVARAVLEHLRRETQQQRGIRLRCRNDFDAHTMWPKLGFRPLRELSGRGKESSTLTEWWLDYGHATLFDTRAAVLDVIPTIRVVMDANIYIDLTTERAQGRETRALHADWVDAVASIHWVVTPELSSELARGGNPPCTAYDLIKPDLSRFDHILPGVLTLLYGTASEVGLSQRQISDARQIAHAVAAEETCYLTRDEALLERAVEFRERFTLDVLHPVELIERLDRMRDSQKYVPALLHDQKLKSVILRASDVEEVADRFLVPAERKSKLVALIRSLIADANTADTHIIADGTDHIALLGLHKISEMRWRIPLLRIRRPGFAGDTLLRHLLWSIVERAAGSNLPILEFSDHDLNREELLTECDFLRGGSSWWRFQATGPVAPPKLHENLLKLSASVTGPVTALLTETAGRIGRIASEGDAAEIERLLWPVLVMDRGVPAFLVPIQPRWAKELFEHRMAKDYLFAPTSHLLLNTENVYYSAAPRPPALGRGSRILWYVSDDSFQLRATSICDQVLVDSGKSLFREFRSLGIYGWPQIRSMIEDPVTKKITDKKIMAIRFSHTRLLDPPIPLDRLRLLYTARTGKPLPVQFPIRIDEAIVRDFLSS